MPRCSLRGCAIRSPTVRWFTYQTVVGPGRVGVGEVAVVAGRIEHRTGVVLRDQLLDERPLERRAGVRRPVAGRPVDPVERHRDREPAERRHRRDVREAESLATASTATATSSSRSRAPTSSSATSASTRNPPSPSAPSTRAAHRSCLLHCAGDDAHARADHGQLDGVHPHVRRCRPGSSTRRVRVGQRCLPVTTCSSSRSRRSC